MAREQNSEIRQVFRPCVSGRGPEPGSSFVDVAILGILFAIVKAP